MIGYVVLLRRAPGLDRESFLHAWLVEHRELAERLPGVREVAFHPTVDADAPFDGVGRLGFDTREDLDACLASEDARRLRAHTATFADEAATIRLVVDSSTGCGRR